MKMFQDLVLVTALISAVVAADNRQLASMATTPPMCTPWNENILYVSTYHSDYQPGDYDYCCKRCSQSPGCISFTWNHRDEGYPDAIQGCSYHYGKDNGTMSDTIFRSARILNPKPFVHYPNTVMVGGSLLYGRNSTAATADLCSAYCSGGWHDGVNTCYSYTYWPGTKVCQLWKGLTQQKTNQGSVSGFAIATGTLSL